MLKLNSRGMLITTVSKAIRFTVSGESRFLTSHRSRSTSHCLSIRHRPNNLFDFGNIHHYYGVPRAPVQEGSLRSLAEALLAPDAENGIYLNPAERWIVLVRHPEHAVLHRAVLHAGRRSRAARTAFGDYSKFFRFLLAGCGKPLGAGLVLQVVGYHPICFDDFTFASHDTGLYSRSHRFETSAIKRGPIASRGRAAHQLQRSICLHSTREQGKRFPMFAK